MSPRVSPVQVHPLVAPVTIEVDLEPAPEQGDPALKARLEAFWTAEKAARGDRLFDGPVFQLARWTRSRLTLWPRTYRHLLARHRVPELAAALGSSFIGVTGVLTYGDQVLMGRRADYLAADPGRWELAPSGTLCRPDPIVVLYDELREELGLAPDAVERPEPFALVLDASSGIAHVCLRVVSRLDPTAVAARHRALATDEYAEVRWLHRAELPGFLEAESGRLLNPLPAMLLAAGLLDPEAAPAHS